ncbi:hypothetical protein [Brevundimonas sp.]|uniref:hypothetical protein n=1 Tax=Brevundimonas sp. TaxID=1871086 RepID=UPI003D6D167C
MDLHQARSQVRDWLSKQKDAFENLVDFEVVEWRGREMALDENLEGPVWRLPGIEVRQFERMELIGVASSVSLGTAQNDDRFGLWLPEVADSSGSKSGWTIPVDDSPFASNTASIFRDVRIPELPVGVVEHVCVSFSAEETEVEAVAMRIGGHVVSLTAGEVYPGLDGSVTISALDESILVQVDGLHPDKRSAGPNV